MVLATGSGPNLSLFLSGLRYFTFLFTVHMPYTPPSQQSPAASRPDSPRPSRSSSNSKSQSNTNAVSGSSSRPGLPRSASSTMYMHKHRRSPSVKKATSSTTDTLTPDASPTTSASASADEQGKSSLESGSRQSSPQTNDFQMQTGVLISPPDSTQNSSDDEDNSKRGRVRKLENLAELQAAIRIIEQHRENSPKRFNEETEKARISLGLSRPRLIPTTTEQNTSPGIPLSKEARKISHSRSSTETLNLSSLPKSTFDSSGGSASDSEIEGAEGSTRIKPQMLRKKSGELVRPALRPSCPKRRPSSMPGTPTYSKAVHFDSHLEHVRHFLQVDKPVAVSVGSSPVEPHENETEFPFGAQDSGSRMPPYEWEIRLTNFPGGAAERVSLPVRVEKVYISTDNKSLIGSVAVVNMSFHKLVVARFTLDYWKTTSEVAAEYVHQKQCTDGLDRFNFNIKLDDQANLETKVLFFCVRYNVNGQEFWDSNNNMNFQVEFIKKAKPQLGKQRMHGASARPLSTSRKASSSVSLPRPWSMPSSLDDYGNAFESRYGFGAMPPPGVKVADESPIRFKNPKAAGDIVPDAPSLRSNAPVQAFGNRYDFGASLSAAIQAASSTVGDRGGNQTENTSASTQLERKGSTRKTKAEKTDLGHVNDRSNESGSSATKTNVSSTSVSDGTVKPAALSEKPTLQSRSYNELLDKYCFVRHSARKDYNTLY